MSEVPAGGSTPPPPPPSAGEPSHHVPLQTMPISTPTRRSWRTWQVLVVGVVLLLVGIVIGAVSNNGASTKSASVQSTSTTSPAAATTAPRPTTTIAATTTTALPTPVSAAAGFPATFDSVRPKLLSLLQGDSNVKSVDKLVFDPGNGTVVLAVTSTWASPDNQVTGAWELTRSVATLWMPTRGAFYDPVWQPNFSLSNSGTNSLCKAPFMVSLADSKASQSDWQAQC
jgi:hypothetical protein